MKNSRILVAILMLFSASAFSQTSEEDVNVYEMSLEDLMDIVIVSASRQEESSFDVPVSSFVVSKSEIELMGATSIPDALRIVPGLIVREISNGTYDVSIRGGIDGFPAYNFSTVNTSILVMIDNRPVFSSLQGGTYWQNLPVGLAEVERIEVVHGPSSALYGPNAVSGVINIITTTPEEVGTYVRANLQGGLTSRVASAVIGKKFNDKFSVDVAANYENRNRFEDTYYNPRSETYELIEEMTTNSIADDSELRFPYPDRSIDKFGATANLRYDHSSDVNFALSASTNNNMALNPLSAGLAISNYSNSSSNIYLKGNLKDLSIQGSFLKGTQGLTGDQTINHYNYQNTDLYVDYNLSVLDGKLNIRPAISYQSAYANDLEYTLDVGENGTFNGEGTINNYAGSLKLDIKPMENLRLILAGRYDQFNYPDEGVLSYQAILNYKIADAHLLRLQTSKSSNGSFLLPTLINTVSPIGPGMTLTLNGNNNLALLSNTVYEVGYRTKVLDNTVLDITAFSQRFDNFYSLILHTPTFDPTTNTVDFGFFNENLPLQVNQQGVTFALQTNFLDQKIQFRPNITIQRSDAVDYSPYYNMQGAYDQPQFGYTLDGHRDDVEDIDVDFTPSVFGGLNIIGRPTSKLSIDLSGYYYGASTLHTQAESSFTTGAITNQPASSISGKFIMNANVNYNLANWASVFVNARNFTNQSAAEGFGTDRLGTSVMLGLKINY
ncbi:MAG: TonB-dependent receptor [Cyclobacteriaceae bacterium]